MRTLDTVVEWRAEVLWIRLGVVTLVVVVVEDATDALFSRLAFSVWGFCINVVARSCRWSR